MTPTKHNHILMYGYLTTAIVIGAIGVQIAGFANTVISIAILFLIFVFMELKRP